MQTTTSRPGGSPVGPLPPGGEESAASPAAAEKDDLKLGVEGLAGFSAGVGSQRVLQEYMQELTAGDEDSHLVEFSDALRSVAKALRHVAESKARAQDEATEWKLKYELEVQRSKQIAGSPGQSFAVEILQTDEWQTWSGNPSANQQDADSHHGIDSPPNGSGKCCSEEGICTQQVIREQGSSSSKHAAEGCCDKNMGSQKTSFRLAWGPDMRKSRQHKHDIVSFERGNITIPVRSSKQMTLQWDSPPQSVFILTKPDSAPVAALCSEMVRWLRDEKGVRVFVENSVKDQLEDDALADRVETCEEMTVLHTKVDLVITLGGDGTVLWAANMFRGPVPPLISFSMGSLGFMTQFQSERYRECLETVMSGPVFITLRHRLHCRIIKSKESFVDTDARDQDEDYLVLNEVSIDRGMSAYLTNLECYCDNLFVTCVQGDGLILSTPSGSTAYSLAAGGSMVHPQVPGILFTPICPHSLSFRPLILPESVTLRIQVPVNSRSPAWASFDGKKRTQLTAGDALIVHMSAWPVPAVCDEESTNDFLRSVREGLHWNLRKSQGHDGPREFSS